jgi:hypothetical protein
MCGEWFEFLLLVIAVRNEATSTKDNQGTFMLMMTFQQLDWLPNSFYSRVWTA